MFVQLLRLSASIDFSDFKKAWNQFLNMGAFEEDAGLFVVEDFGRRAPEDDEAQRI